MFLSITGFSRNHLVKVVNELFNHGVLGGKRVCTGGIKPAGAPEDITLGLILRLMEPSNGLFACEPHHGPQYILADIYGLSRITGKAINAFLAVLLLQLQFVLFVNCSWLPYFPEDSNFRLSTARKTATFSFFWPGK